MSTSRDDSDVEGNEPEAGFEEEEVLEEAVGSGWCSSSVLSRFFSCSMMASAILLLEASTLRLPAGVFASSASMRFRQTSLCATERPNLRFKASHPGQPGVWL